MNNGNKVCNMSLATSETWRDKSSGERQERTEWHRVVVFNDKLIEAVIEKYCHKGDQIRVTGQLQTRKWTDQQGVEKYTTEVVLQNFKGEIELLGGGSGGSSNRDDRDDDRGSSGGGGAAASDDLDDEIPFAVCWDVDRKRRFTV